MIFDTERNIIIITDEDLSDKHMNPINELLTVIRTAAIQKESYHTNKIIHVSAKKKGFFYLKNKFGKTGKFKPTEEEYLYIMEKLL